MSSYPRYKTHALQTIQVSTHADIPHPLPEFPGNPLREAHLPDNITPVGYGNTVIVANNHNMVSVTQNTPLTALLVIASLGHCQHFFLPQHKKTNSAGGS